MPAFADPFVGNVPARKMTIAELVRAIRLDLAAEEEAIHQYLAQADATEHPLAAKVLADVANEERTHAGEFLRLLQILTGDEDKWLAEGAGEVDTAAAGLKPAEAPATQPAGGATIGSLKE